MQVIENIAEKLGKEVIKDKNTDVKYEQNKVEGEGKRRMNDNSD